MKYLILILVLLSFNSLQAQYSEIDNTVVFNYDIDYSVELDTTISINRDHKLSNYIADQGKDYVEWVYRLNEQRNKSTAFDANLINDNGDQNTLVFTLTENGETTFDTLVNKVNININSKPKKIGFFRRLWHKIRMPNIRSLINKIDIEGSLPEGCMSWTNVSGSRLKCGVEIVKPSSTVSIFLKDRNKQVVYTFVEGTLHRGWNNYEWNRGDYDKGLYFLEITVDGQTMTQGVNFD